MKNEKSIKKSQPEDSMECCYLLSALKGKILIDRSFSRFWIKFRDPRTKTGRSRTERFGPGPTTGPAQENFRNLGPDRTRTERILEIPDQLGPRPRQS